MSRKVRHPPSTDPVDQVIEVPDPRSPSPEYFVDLTVDSPWPQRPRASVRINCTLRRHHRNQADQAESSQIQNAEMPDLELIDHSNRLLPPKKRNRTSKSPKDTPVINLDESTPSEAAEAAAARVNDSVSGESNVLSCPICLEYLNSKRKPTSTRCGHVYCEECIQQTLTMSKKCPKCQAGITPKSCIRLYF